MLWVSRTDLEPSELSIHIFTEANALLVKGLVAMKPRKRVTKRRRRKGPSPDPRWTKVLSQGKLAHIGKLRKDRKEPRSRRSHPRLEELGGMLSGTTTAERLFAILKESREDED